MSNETFLDIQRRQFEHDTLYHPDILALKTSDKLKHMTLHNAKYAAKFSEAMVENDDAKFEHILVDAFVIAIATANTLTTDLSSILGSPAKDNVEGSSKNQMTFVQRYLSEVGTMAKACESIDHLEDFPYRRVITSSNINVLKLVLQEARLRKVDIFKRYKNRLADVESLSGFKIFHENKNT